MGSVQPNQTAKHEKNADVDETGSGTNLISFPFLQRDSSPNQSQRDERRELSDTPLVTARTRALATSTKILGITGASAAASFIVLLTALGIATILRGGSVPVGQGGTGVSAFIKDLVEFYTGGLGIAVTAFVITLAIGLAVFLIPRRRDLSRQ